MQHSQSPSASFAVELLGIEKSFGGVKALRGADLMVREGEILGLCGENGAGKSTLIKIMSGAYAHDSYRGAVKIFGKERQLRNPADSRRAGVAVVYQELMLVPELSVAENLLLGREPRHLALVDDARVEAMARSELERFGFADRIDPVKTVAEHGIGLQQAIEIIRALALDARILILDEPTAALSAQETQELLGWLRKLKSQGTTCIYVSHRLDEVFAICDRVTVLRDGRHVATVEAKKSSADEVVSLMVGHSVESRRKAPREFTLSKTAALRLDGFGVRRTATSMAVSDVTLNVQPGEIVGICGAVGSGRTALLSGIFGCAKAGTVGAVSIEGYPVEITSPAEAIAKRVAFVPEDRKGAGVVLEMSIAENLALPSLTSPKLMGWGARFGLVDDSAEAALARRSIKSLRIRGEADRAVATLSGGNQQKVVLGKWLEDPPRVLLLDEPTRGVDVGAREEIYGILERLADHGIAVLFATSDLAEALRLAHRIIVLRQGRVVGEMTGDMASEEAIVRLSTGARSETSASGTLEVARAG
ncbi:MAG TPA: sugar ABC transporter ATP-binding protein [Polyangiaceae bacterium]|nr:sugar ABC transporter ATP-binding protein [Polyangiaceae bacterium]